MTPQIEEKKELRELLAGLAHEQWAGWMAYLFSKCRYTDMGDAVIPKASVLHWQRQMGTPYDDLSEAEKDSDRKEADRVLAVCLDARLGRQDEQEKTLGAALLPADPSASPASTEALPNNRKRLRLFGPSNCPDDADMCIGDVDDLAASSVWEILTHYLPQMDEDERLVFRVKAMTDAEVEAMPDV